MKTRTYLAFAALAGGAGLIYVVSARRSFAADVRAICSSESRAETTIPRGRVVVESIARKDMHGSDGLELVDTLKSVSPEDAAINLRAAADKAGVSDCAAVASYRALSARLALQKSAARMCRDMEPTPIARTPRAARFTRVRDWARAVVADPALDALLADVDPPGAATPEETTTRFRGALSDLEVHDCGVLAGLTSALDPLPGANAMVQSVAVQNDAREAAVAAALRAKVPDYRRCYEAGLAKDSSLAGTMSIKFRLNESGVIDFALVQDDSTLLATNVLGCVVDAVKTAQGPAGAAKNPGGLIVVFWNAK